MSQNSKRFFTSCRSVKPHEKRRHAVTCLRAPFDCKHHFCTYLYSNEYFANLFRKKTWMLLYDFLVVFCHFMVVMNFHDFFQFGHSSILDALCNFQMT